MKKKLVKLLLIVMALSLLPVADGFCGKKKKRHRSKNPAVLGRSPESRTIARAVGERWWVHGKIRGNGNVVTVILESLNGSGYQLDTSTNKYGEYAFSNVGQGNPSDYKLLIYSGDRVVKQVSLKGIRKGRRVPDIKLW